MKKTTNKFAPEVRERAVRMVRDHEHEHPSRRAAEQQAGHPTKHASWGPPAAMLLSVRALLVRQRTQVANALRGHAAEFGVVAAKGIGRIETLMAAVDAAGDRRSATGQMPAAAKQALALLANRLGQLDAELAALDRRLAALHAATPLSRLLAAVPGIGPSGFPAREHAGVPSALTLALSVAPERFANGRHFAAWLGLTGFPAREIGVPTNRITAIMAGTRAITAETALKLAARFGTSAEFWMNLQTANDLAMARQALAAA